MHRDYKGMSIYLPSYNYTWRKIDAHGTDDRRRMVQNVDRGRADQPPLVSSIGLLPSNPRCKLCAAPFKGWGGFIMHLMGRDQSKYNPRFCQPCEKFEHPCGAEIPLTMLFADVRGSTKLAEQMSALEFSRLMNRFYTAASHILIQTDALVDRFIGDEAIGLYIPGFAGSEHPRRAIEAAQDFLNRQAIVILKDHGCR